MPTLPWNWNAQANIAKLPAATRQPIPITIITTDVQDGPVCLLVKESYGNAFAPWLTTHYSKIIMVDPREFNRDGGRPKLDLVSFAQEHGVDDVIILNYPMAYNSIDFSIYIERLVGGYEGTP